MKQIIRVCKSNLRVGINQQMQVPIGYYAETTTCSARMVINPVRFIQHFRNHYQSIGLLDEVLASFTLHELGHHLDEELPNKLAKRLFYHNTWRDIDVPVNFRKHPIGLALTNIKCLPHIILENQTVVSYETTAWEFGEKLNEVHTIVSTTVLQKIKKEALSTYRKPLEIALLAYATWNNPNEDMYKNQKSG